MNENLHAKLVIKDFFVECPHCGTRLDREYMYSSRIVRMLDTQCLHCPGCCKNSKVDFFLNH